MTLQRRRFVSWPTSRTLSSGCGRARELVRHHQRNSQWRRDCPPPAPPWWWTAGRRGRGLPTPRTEEDGDPGAGPSTNTSKMVETTGRDPADNEVPACRLETARRRPWREAEQSALLEEVEGPGSTMPAWRPGQVCRLCTSPSPHPAWWTVTVWPRLMEITTGKHRKYLHLYWLPEPGVVLII